MKHEKKEFEGINMEAALQEAEDYFGLPREKLAYRIVKEKSSLFGKHRKIVIQAWARDETKEEDLKSFLNFLKEKLHLNGEFFCRDSRGNMLVVEYRGDDYYIFTENHGELLNALQYILNKLFPSIGKRIITDTHGFRRQREYYLRRLARRVAERVRETGEEELLFPMEPNERRIIHMVVNSMDGVASQSEGEGPIKRVKIFKLKDV